MNRSIIFTFNCLTLFSTNAYAGTWGAGSFDNDSAFDWVYDLERSKSASDLLNVFNAVPTMGYIDLDTCSAVIAAADVAASLKDGKTDHLPKSVATWIESNKADYKPDISFKAVDAINICKNIDRSELAQLWSEATPKEWLSEISEIEERLISPVGVLSLPEALPTGWRLPAASEISSQPMRNWDPSGFVRVQADFNSDGKMDYAHLVKSEVFDGEGFAVYLSTPSGYSWEIIDQFAYRTRSTRSRLYMGLGLANPGSYKTACGKGYWECKEGETETLVLASPGISYFRFESASSLWYWDNSKKIFVQDWISD